MEGFFPAYSCIKSETPPLILVDPQMYAATQAASSERVLEVWLQAAAELGATPSEIERCKGGVPQ